MIRLFIALDIPDEVKENIYTILKTVPHYSSEFRWEPKEKIHLTLKFIGDIPEESLEDIISEIDFAKEFSTFNCTISKFGFFFKDNNPAILWCNFETDDQIISLTKELNVRLRKYGIEDEKQKFKGHLTLLRIKKRVSEDFIISFKEFKFEPIQFKCNTISLIQSLLKISGSEYKVLKIYELK